MLHTKRRPSLSSWCDVPLLDKIHAVPDSYEFCYVMHNCRNWALRCIVRQSAPQSQRYEVCCEGAKSSSNRMLLEENIREYLAYSYKRERMWKLEVYSLFFPWHSWNLTNWPFLRSLHHFFLLLLLLLLPQCFSLNWNEILKSWSLPHPIVEVCTWRSTRASQQQVTISAFMRLLHTALFVSCCCRCLI